MVDSCVLAGLGLAFHGLGHPPSLNDYFAAYCTHYGVSLGSRSVERAYAEHFVPAYNAARVSGQRFLETTLKAASGGPFASASAAFKITYLPSIAARLAWLEAKVRNDRCLASVSISVSPTMSHTVCAGQDGADFYWYDAVPVSGPGPVRLGGSLSRILQVLAQHVASQNATFHDGFLVEDLAQQSGASSASEGSR
jgi:hypothetical protein